MISRIFIDRPVFAWVIAIVIMLAGVGGDPRRCRSSSIPTSRRPSVNIRASYPGASAETLENSVTQVIEQQLTGIDGLLYFSSNSSSAGQATITVTFEQGHQPRHRPGAGAEQGAAGAAAPAAGGAAAGPGGHQVATQTS